ncbi:Thioredoxin domain containing protein [Trichuris trichiura]|uniref:Thioredoxin domain-containing protein 9 n=1 Tax=Trichuris trichiura TaxID=36087 RepID=A0A077ZKR1_TRITR|nr:Thioredoxin domain containing protein [Trichuris trichiura]
MASGVENSRQLEVIAEAAKALENQLDAAIDRLENLDNDELIALRRKRLEQLKKREHDKRKWVNAGHGTYTELNSDTEFFEAGKRSERFVVMFYSNATERCQLLDSHLITLSRKHLECRFCKLNIHKAQFTVKRLNLRLFPTLVSFINGQTVDFLRASEGCVTKDKLTLDLIEYYLSRCEIKSKKRRTAIADKEVKKLEEVVFGGNSKFVGHLDVHLQKDSRLVRYFLIIYKRCLFWKKTR